MTRAYYNEFDPSAAAWLRKLIAAGLIAPGDVDERSIVDVTANDIHGYTQCHLFAGIGGWSLALRLAKWDDSRHVWTGSCPCQPFSCAGKGEGEADERHLWPEFFRLIGQCRPAIVFGEQVASKPGRRWLSGVFADLENVGYAVAGADLCAAGVQAPHIRQRLYWVADADTARFNAAERPRERQRASTGAGCGAVVDGVAHTECHRPNQGRGIERSSGGQGSAHRDDAERCSGDGRLADTEHKPGCSEYVSDEGERKCKGQEHGAIRQGDIAGPYDNYRMVDSCAAGLSLPESGELRGPWWGTEGGATLQSGGAWWPSLLVSCTDGYARRISAQPGDEPLAYGIPLRMGPLVSRLGELEIGAGIARRIISLARRHRIGGLRGYGNAIVPEVAAEFIRAYEGVRI
jgi:DNA (cytosine-5)-methyltransferase 1